MLCWKTSDRKISDRSSESGLAFSNELYVARLRLDKIRVQPALESVRPLLNARLDIRCENPGHHLMLAQLDYQTHVFTPVAPVDFRAARGGTTESAIDHRAHSAPEVAGSKPYFQFGLLAEQDLSNNC